MMDVMKKWVVVFLLAIGLAMAGGAMVARVATQSRVVSFAPAPSSPDGVAVLAASTPSSSAPAPQSFCATTASFADSADDAYCAHAPKENAFRLFEINLTDSKILFWENGLLQQTFPIAYQSPYGKWFETPTGYFSIGVKREKLKSSIVDVFMEKAVQFYEDFFIHAIPYYPDGTKVTSQFSGGCVRLDDAVANTFYATAQKGDAVVSYATLARASMRPGFFAPVDLANFWIRQRFNSPIRTTWLSGADKQLEYEQHAGVDFAPDQNAPDLTVHAVYPGTVESIIQNGVGDAGLGNAVILKHDMNEETLYSLYAHLDAIDPSIVVGGAVVGGQTIGTVGNTGYGCHFWHIGGNGCQASGAADTHLHLEIKTAPTLIAPIADPSCLSITGRAGSCVGYTSDTPTKFGYRDPMTLIFNSF
jgi:murein DD-endopeptidase MepM/ murein hydrolase activator NlpD